LRGTGQSHHRPEDSASQSKNTFGFGWQLKDRAMATVVAGKLVWSEQTDLAAV
jgi:dihydroorotase-like cyclic amidohydrolase